MTRARNQLISLDDTPYYHCIARCVRRSFLCGDDKYSGKNFDHRRQWLVDQFKFQTDIFCIEVSAYAVMNNHYHLVLFIDEHKARSLSDKDIAVRWTQLFHAPLLIQRFLKDQVISAFEQQTVSDIITLWRERLMDISWFMRVLNEFIARKANAEDDCKGRFWEGRFKSQALLDNHALLSCMMYVDLNPVRAGMANSLDDSDFTSIQERLRSLSEKSNTTNRSETNAQPLQLSKLLDPEERHSIPISAVDYITLTDWTGRCIQARKRGRISPKAPKVLLSLGLDEQEWLYLCYSVQRSHPIAVGDNSSLRIYNEHHHKHWTIINRHDRPR